MIADTPTVVVVVVALIATGAGAAIGLFVRPSVFFALGLGASVMSGNWERLGLPIGLDRMLMLGGLGALVLGVTVSPRPPGVRKFRAVEVVMVVLAAIAIASALVAGSLTQPQGFYALLDRLGIVPFVAFALADRVFGTEEDRRFLVGVMTVVGAYLAVTAVFEIVGMTALVFPKYINDPLIGTHWGRARGPFLEAGADGLALFECGVAATVGVAIFRRRAARLAGIAVAAACGLGVLLTLTRADWIAAVVGAIVGCLLHPRARRWLLPVAGVVAVAVVVALVLIPGLATRASDRASDQKPVWDRKNTNTAAVRIVEAHPLFGVGWQQFVPENADYVRQADDYPLSQVTIGVHNVFLSYAAELGLVGGVLWLAAVGLGAAAAWKGGASMSPEWRAASMAILVNWLVVGAFQPLAFAFPNLCVWLWLGVAAAPTARRLRSGARVSELEAAATSPAT